MKDYRLENEILENIERFVRKYYLNQFIRGLLMTAGITGIIFIALVITEYFGYLDTGWRTVLFFAYLLIAAVLLLIFTIIPLFRYKKIGRTINEEDAARFIGRHFSDIADRLLNTLQLIKIGRELDSDGGLLKASIIQRTKDLRIFKFENAVSIKQTIRVFKYMLIPLLLILLSMIIMPGNVTEPANRLIQFNKQFEKPVPFTIEILNKNLVAVQQQDFILRIKLSGSEIPAEIGINIEGVNYKMNREKDFVFIHRFRTLQNSKAFYFESFDYKSREYELIVFPKPVILNFIRKLTFPSYLNKQPEIQSNEGDCSVPEGTLVEWVFTVKDADNVIFKRNGESIDVTRDGNGTFRLSQKLFENISYTFFPVNRHTFISDSLSYNIQVIRDGYPSVNISEYADSSVTNTVFVTGTIKDDYGFSALFGHVYLLNRETRDTLNRIKVQIPIDKAVNNQNFLYAIDLDSINLMNSGDVSYFFEVWDNDGIRGSKSARSEVKTVVILSKEEMERKVESNEEEISDFLEKGKELTEKMNRDIEVLKKRMIEERTSDWQERKKLEELLDKSKELETKLEKIQKMNRENLEMGEKSIETSERLLEKQRMINEMLDQIMTPELKKQLDEIRELLKKVDKDKVNEMLEKIKLSTKELERELDRNLGLLEKLAFERKTEKAINDLRKMSENMEELSKRSVLNQQPEKIVSEQERLNSEYDSLKKRISEVEELGRKLEDPVDLGDSKSKLDTISKKMQEGLNDLKSGNSNKAAKEQKDAGSKMNELANAMEQSLNSQEEEQMGEDAKTIRILLENILRLSFEQERLITTTGKISRNDPSYNQNQKKQKDVVTQIGVVEDSLQAIAKRQVMIKPVISKEIAVIKSNVTLVLESMDQRNINQAVTRQQYIMTALNNLAVMLNESLEKMNEQMAQSMSSKSGNKSCSKPGNKGGKMSAKGIKEMQKALGEQLKRLKEGMEGKKNEGMNKSGSSSMFSREIAKLAAQQEAIRNEMQKMRDGSDGLSAEEREALNQIAKEMEQMEKDLVNKKVNNQLLERQQNILTRLLESEKAEMMRDKEEERKSTEAKNQKYSNPNGNFKYNGKKDVGMDEIKYTVPSFSPFYRNKINGYIVKIGN